jgi:glycosyltransferase involved in cell wall biosynthesis
VENEFAPLVTVVIPTYNYGHFVGEAIESVLCQTYKNFELIIVDNFSQDNTAELVSSFLDDRIKFMQFENKGSIAAARNFGWKNSNGRLVAFLDADDSWHPMKLSKQVKLHVSNLAVSHHDLKLFGAKNFGVAKGRHLKGNPAVEMLTGGNPILTSSVVMPRQLLESSGGFPENLEIVSAEDFALWLLVGELGAKFVYLPKVLGKYRLHESSSSSGRSATAAAIVTDKYRSNMSRGELKKLDGWLSYAHGVTEASGGARRGHFMKAVMKASMRFKWRALIRIIIPQR